MSRLLVGVFWLLHWLPFRGLVRVGDVLGRLLMALARRRRHIAATNLRLCFPNLDETARGRLLRAHFQALGRSFVDRGVLWWAPRERLERFIRVEGLEHVEALRAQGVPVILLAPHFVGLDAGGVAMAMRLDCVSIYARQKNAVFDRLILRGRKRFGDQVLLSRSDGVRPSLKALKSGRPFYYLPDMNFRTPDAIFVPFFGVPALTTTGLPRLARVARAAVVNCVTRMRPEGGYVLEIGPPWEAYPGEDADADTARMNREIERLVRTMPEQYYWVHRRFKSVPPGEPARY